MRILSSQQCSQALLQRINSTSRLAPHSSLRTRMMPQISSFLPAAAGCGQEPQRTTRSFATKELSSERALRSVELLPSYLADARSVARYNPVDSPNGALQLGVAESQMLEDLLVPALNMPIDIQSDCIYYQSTHGRLSCRESMVSYISSLVNLPKSASLDVEGLVLGAGCNAVLENLCLCLAEPGEAVMIPTPYYAAFEFDLVARANLHVQPVTTQDYHNSKAASNQSVDPTIYYPTATALTAAFDKALQAGHPPRILLLSHPHNPLGICYPKHVVQECIDWCKSNKVHLVSDEIYAGSVYGGENSGFHSALQLAADEKIRGGEGLGLGPYIHWVYAMSKDFALSGLRVGVAYSENQEIRLPFQKLNDLCQISSQTQVWVETLMKKSGGSNDNGSGLWVENFREENHRRLRARCEALTKCLEECGIPYLQPTAGLFCWVDLSRYLPSEGDDSERERSLYLEMVQNFGLLLTPGNSMRNEKPGFFRIVFTAASDHEFELGLERLRQFAAAKAK